MRRIRWSPSSTRPRRSVGSSLVAPEPAYLLVPEFDYTLGSQVAEVSALAGFAPDATQAMILDGVFAERNGLPAAFEALLVGPRQNFKSGVLEQIMLGWMFVTGESGATWTAHIADTARGSFEHLSGLIERTPSLSSSDTRAKK